MPKNASGGHVKQDQPAHHHQCHPGEVTSRTHSQTITPQMPVATTSAARATYAPCGGKMRAPALATSSQAVFSSASGPRAPIAWTICALDTPSRRGDAPPRPAPSAPWTKGAGWFLVGGVFSSISPAVARRSGCRRSPRLQCSACPAALESASGVAFGRSICVRSRRHARSRRLSSRHPHRLPELAKQTPNSGKPNAPRTPSERTRPTGTPSSPGAAPTASSRCRRRRKPLRSTSRTWSRRESASPPSSGRFQLSAASTTTRAPIRRATSRSSKTR